MVLESAVSGVSPVGPQEGAGLRDRTFLYTTAVDCPHGSELLELYSQSVCMGQG
jgi:hypothetical protein